MTTLNLGNEWKVTDSFYKVIIYEPNFFKESSMKALPCDENVIF